MRPPRLLVIDDEPAVREIECECLSLLGYDVEAARDEADGLARLTPERFDLVVTDLHMPHLNGWKSRRGVGLHRSHRRRGR